MLLLQQPAIILSPRSYKKRTEEKNTRETQKPRFTAVMGERVKEKRHQ